MSKTVTIKLTRVGIKHGPFLIKDEFGNIIADDVTRQSLITGMSFIVDDASNIIVVVSKGDCTITKSFPIKTITKQEYVDTRATSTKTSCMWKHLANPTIYNIFYGKIEPYIIEYPFSFSYNDEILQSVKDYTKSYKYFINNTGVFDDNERIEINSFFNKAVLYNNQQSTGVLNLVPKPLNNLSVYSSYPKFHTDSKTILFTKSDNFYQYNTFWSIVSDKTKTLFTKTCESLSIDKVVNQANMDYSSRSFKKEPLRAKDLKIRHQLDNTSEIHLVSQFITTNNQISYK